MPEYYEIKIKGHLDPHWSDWFSGLELTYKEVDETLLSGVLPDQAAGFIRAVAGLPGIEIEGVYTHFCCADSDPAYTRQQLQCFQDVLHAADVRLAAA